MQTIFESIETEYRRYKLLAEGAIQQVPAEQLSAGVPAGSNSIAKLVWHVSGNLESRFTDFLTTDGEKPWRDRDSEFVDRRVTPEELIAKWERGFAVLFGALRSLTAADLCREVRIRGQPLAVHAALLRSLAHTSCHVGQIVYIAKSLCGAEWQTLSIPLGGSAAYDANPTFEKAPRHVERPG